MRWIVRGWCRDCCGDDPHGCFDGQTIEFGSEGGTEDRIVPFDTKEAAEEAGWKFVGTAPYEFELVEQE